MAIRFVLPAEEAESVAFAYSPVVEAVLSLHVLVAPKHHPLQHAWVRRMRVLDSALRAEIRAFAFAYWDHFSDFLFPRPDHEFLDFEDELAQLHELDAETIAFEFLRPMYDHEGSWPRPQALLVREDVKTHAVQRAQVIAGDDGAALARLMFEDPRELARRVACLLERYWNDAFADEWRRIEPILAGAVQDAGSRLVIEGVLGVLGDHVPRLQIDADRREVWIKLPHEHEVLSRRTSRSFCLRASSSGRTCVSIATRRSPSASSIPRKRCSTKRRRSFRLTSSFASCARLRTRRACVPWR